MMKGFALLLASASVSAVLLANQSEAALRGHLELDREVITLGDLFDNAGPLADKVVAPAARPGKSLSFELTDLRILADEYGIQWEKPLFRGPVHIQRAGYRISEMALSDRLSEEVRRKGFEGKWRLDITNAPENLWVSPQYSDLSHLQFESFEFDRERGRFSARMNLPGDFSGKMVRLSGRAYKLQAVASLVKPVGKGEVIEASDVTVSHRRADRIRGGVVLAKEDLVGMQANRSLRAGTPVRQKDITSPRIVRKGSMVTIALQTKKMTLSTVGRAMENGSIGDVILIKNEQSKRIVKGKVLGHGIVRAIFRQQVADATIQ